MAQENFWPGVTGGRQSGTEPSMGAPVVLPSWMRQGHSAALWRAVLGHGLRPPRASVQRSPLGRLCSVPLGRLCRQSAIRPCPCVRYRGKRVSLPMEWAFAFGRRSAVAPKTSLADRRSTMLIGYARTSTLEQKAGIETQIEALKALGCERLYSEQVSSIAVRDALREALAFCREGDTLVVTKLDRLARSVRHLGDIVEALEHRKVGLRVLDLGLDTGNATGKLMLNVLGSVAQFEREMMLERQKEGIAKAKSEGKYLGRQPTSKVAIAQVQSLLDGGTTKRTIASLTGLSERTVYRIANAQTPQQAAQVKIANRRSDGVRPVLQEQNIADRTTGSSRTAST